jgi:hypothetical protein
LKEILTNDKTETAGFQNGNKLVNNLWRCSNHGLCPFNYPIFSENFNEAMKQNSNLAQVVDALQLEQLTSDELLITDGGESAWYWVAYYVGSFHRSASIGPSHYHRYRAEFGK